MGDYILSECELYVMKVIWKSKESLSVQEITERVNRLYEKNWNQKTVSAFLGRIVNKKLLISKRQGRYFYYYPTITEEEYCQKEALKCVNILVDGQVDGFLSALSRARKLTSEEKEKIRGLLDELD